MFSHKIVRQKFLDNLSTCPNDVRVSKSRHRPMGLDSGFSIRVRFSATLLGINVSVRLGFRASV